MWMKILQTFKWGSVQRKVLIMGSLLASIPVLVMGTMAYWSASSSIMNEVRTANSQMMLQVQQRIDEKLMTLENIALQNASNPTLMRFLSLPDPDSNYELYGVTLTLLSSIQTLIDDVDSVYLYLPEKQKVVSSDRGIKDDNTLAHHIKQAIDRERPEKLWLDHKVESTAYREVLHQITYIRKIVTHDNSSEGYLIVNLDETTLFRIFASMKLGKNRELLIVTPSYNVFSDSSNHLFHSPLDETPFIREIMNMHISEKMWIENIEGRSVSVNYLESPHNGWRYITLVPYSDITMHLKRIEQTTVGICLILVSVSIVASGVVSKRWLYALQSLVETIKNKGDLPNGEGKQNEFELIRQYFEFLEHDKVRLKQQIDESMPILKNNFIQRLLTEPYREEMADQALYYEIPVRSEHYSILCIEPDNMRGKTEQDRILFHYAVMNIAKEIINKVTDGLVIQTHSGHIVVLLNHQEDQGVEVAPSHVFGIAEEIRHTVGSLLNITVTIGIGRSCKGFGQIRRSFRESMEALDYQLVQGSGKVLYIGQVQLESASLQYPSECEQQIITSLKLGNLSKIQELLDEFAETLRAETGDSGQIRQSYIQLLAVCLRTMLELDGDNTEMFPYNPYERLLSFNTTEKMIGWLKNEVYPRMTEHVRLRLQQRTHSTIQKALSYIHDNYDYDLSIPLVAGFISVPVSQFSHVFKAEVGMTFSEYVLMYRMEKAKELLRDSDARISDIADKLRYNNSQNFIRVFKKMYGMTPGEFRTRIRGQ
ncbi:HTH-type transcriptional regulator YesS [Paenibacillus auburnensis]|uniref:HTH-type transcriptional regulator YesS n=1 Tax=Paenibacillus auburnensis TaxID=2905649 RepID=A0ABM9CCT5_9BACL|nr:helix-turn-helix domain-containing protein [Paenibacillus auburnensis]CAH1208354.1 HTH-type transcriptional regulator YesS [Paenibacillus auburnensis]